MERALRPITERLQRMEAHQERDSGRLQAISEQIARREGADLPGKVRQLEQALIDERGRAAAAVAEATSALRSELAQQRAELLQKVLNERTARQKSDKRLEELEGWRNRILGGAAVFGTLGGVVVSFVMRLLPG